MKKLLLLAILTLFAAVLPAAAAQGGDDTPITIIPPVQATAITPVIDIPVQATAITPAPGPCSQAPEYLPPECLPDNVDWSLTLTPPATAPSSASGAAATEPPSTTPPDEGGSYSTPTATPTVVQSWPVHCYILIEVINPALEPRLADIWQTVQGIGQQVGDADETTQLRVRLDRRAALIESTFDPAELTAEALAGRLAFELEAEITEEDLLLYPFECYQGYATSRAAALEYLWANLPQWQVEFRLS